jgi:hypothetical protein
MTNRGNWGMLTTEATENTEGDGEFGTDQDRPQFPVPLCDLCVSVVNLSDPRSGSFQ